MTRETHLATPEDLRVRRGWEDLISNRDKSRIMVGLNKYLKQYRLKAVMVPNWEYKLSFIIDSYGTDKKTRKIPRRPTAN